MQKVKSFLERKIADLEAKQEAYIEALQKDPMKTLEWDLAEHVRNNIKLQQYKRLDRISELSIAELNKIMQQAIVNFCGSKRTSSNEGANFVADQTPRAFAEMIEEISWI